MEAHFENGVANKKYVDKQGSTRRSWNDAGWQWIAMKFARMTRVGLYSDLEYVEHGMRF